jgi:hypothetical protein
LEIKSGQEKIVFISASAQNINNLSLAKGTEAKMTNGKSLRFQNGTKNIAGKQQIIIK